MRFFVHVTPIGKVDTQSYCVEADSWQKALQGARNLRREDAPISGFSIELTDNGGCRAVDPAARLRYVVKRAPDTAVLTTPEQTGAPRNTSRTQTIGYGTTGAIPVRTDPGLSQPQIAPPTDVAPANGVEPHVLYRREQEPTDDSPLLYREDVYVMPEGTTEAQAEKYLRAQFLTIKAVLASSRTGKYVNLAVFDRAFEGRPTVLPLATLSWKDWKGQEPSVVYPRSTGTKSFAPFTVPEPQPRFAAPVPAPVLASASDLAPAQKPSDSGVLVAPVVNVASTAEASHVGPPPSQRVAPASIVALGEALRKASQPPPAPSAVAVGHATQVGGMTAVAPVADARPPSALDASRKSSPPVSAAAAAIAPIETAAAAAAPPAAEKPSFPPPATRLSTPEPRQVPGELLGLTPDPAGRLSTSGRTSSRPSRPSGPRGRVRGDELIAVLFEAMHDLHFSRDALEASEFCLQLALENIPSRAAFAHFYDIDKREYVIAAAVGAGTAQMVLRHHPPTDPLLSTAMRKRAAIVISDASGNDDAFVERFELLGGAKSVIVAPVMLGGRALAAIELVNPTDGGPYTEAEGNAMTYMGEQFAEYVSSHGLVLDPERIRRRGSA